MQGAERSKKEQSVATDTGQKTIADYLGDMVALESHIEEALDRQLELSKKHGEAAAAIQQFHDMVKANRDALKAHQEQVGSTAGNPIIEAGSAVLGKVAGLIDNLRPETVSKALRDDYTAFNLAAVSYTMLQTTALAVGDQATAELAKQGLRGHAAAVQKINHLIPTVVVKELEEDGLTITDRTAADQTRKALDKIWKETDQAS
jgi:ferritin-like metal-binding protein YciE